VTFTNRVQAYSDRLLQTAKHLVAACVLTVTEHGMLDPKILAFLLLCRTIPNYEAAVLLGQRRLVVEARTLARCCCENMFLVAALHEQGRAFADLMKEDDDAGRQNRLKFARSTDEIFESLEPEMQQAVISMLANSKKSNLLSPKAASRVGVFKTAYLAHSQFSGDAAHATLTALARYWRRNEDKTVEFDVRPQARQDELDQTLLFASMAVLGLLGTVDDMFGGLPVGKSLPTLRDELQALQDEE
jgi:hypothetical protein